MTPFKCNLTPSYLAFIALLMTTRIHRPDSHLPSTISKPTRWQVYFTWLWSFWSSCDLQPLFSLVWLKHNRLSLVILYSCTSRNTTIELHCMHAGENAYMYVTDNWQWLLDRLIISKTDEFNQNCFYIMARFRSSFYLCLKTQLLTCIQYSTHHIRYLITLLVNNKLINIYSFTNKTNRHFGQEYNQFAYVVL